jgi:DNA-binding CsgD family transcriptional regulator
METILPLETGRVIVEAPRSLPETGAACIVEDCAAQMEADRAGNRLDSLLERDGELEQIGALLTRTGEGHGGVMLAEAAAGLGKSSLLSAAAGQAAAQGLEVVHASAPELGSEIPFGVCIDLFETRLAAAAESEREELLGGAAQGAKAIFDPTAASQPVPDAAEQLFPILHGFLWLTSNLAERSGLLVVVDDLHWADRPSLQFLLYLSSRLSELPVAAVLASRSGEPDAPEELLNQLRARPGLVRLSPTPLSEDATARLVRERMPGAEQRFCDACIRATAGNPHLISELLAELRSQRIQPDREGAKRVEGFVPDLVRDAAEVRLERLGPDAVSLARAAVVLGLDASLRRASRLAGLDPERAAVAADALAAASIMRGDGTLAFAHPLVRASIESAMPAENLADGHDQAARLIAADNAAPERVAMHLLDAGGRADPWTVRQLREAAARALSRGVPDSAVRYLQRALEEPPEETERAALLVELAQSEALAARPEAIERLEQALDLHESGQERARLLLQLGRLLHDGGRVAEAATSFERGLRELGGADEGLELELETAFLDTAWLDSSRAAEVAELRKDLADRRRDERTAGDRVFLAQTAMIEVFSGDSSETVINTAERLLGDGALLREEGPDSIGLWIAVGCLSWSDALDSAERATGAALAEAEENGSVTASAQALYARSWPRYWRGRTAEAVADAQAAVDAWGAAGGWGKYLPAAQYWLAVALIDRGELDAAEAALELNEPERWQSTTLYLMWRTAHGWLALARGDHRTALEEALAAGKQLTDVVRLKNPAALPWRSLAALAAHGLGDDARARELAGQEVRLARHFGARRPLGIALRSAGIAEGGDRGVELLRESAEVLEGSPSCLELCRTLIDLGATLRREGGGSEARETLRSGLDMAHRFEAWALADRAEEELRASGARPRRRVLKGPDSLTPAQRRVAEMAAKGLSNREVAQALFVTRRTVETHLTEAYSKLGIDSREELPTALDP